MHPKRRLGGQSGDLNSEYSAIQNSSKHHALRRANTLLETGWKAKMASATRTTALAAMVYGWCGHCGSQYEEATIFVFILWFLF